MAFEAVKNLSTGGSCPVAPPGDNFTFEAQAAIKEGAAIKYRTDTSGKVNKAVNADKNVIAIALEAAAADEDEIRGAYVVPGMVYKCPITDKDGTSLTALHANFKRGKAVDMNDNGDGIDGATDSDTFTHGPCTIIDFDADDEVAWVVFNTGALFLNVDTVSQD